MPLRSLIASLTAALTLLLTPSASQAGQGHDFIEEARALYRVAACGNADLANKNAAPPANTSARDHKIITRHCREQQRRLQRFRSRYIKRAQPFLARQRPDALPTTVVYPFGGGDLVSALLTYPDATEITTISLEHSGDPRRFADLTGAPLRDALALYRDAVGGLLRNNDSASANMRKVEGGPIPGQLSFFLQGLVALDYEPISLRYFQLTPDGAIDYLDRAAIDALADNHARKKGKNWVDTDHSVAFSNSEIRFRRRGQPDAPVLTHRHIAFNLNNDKFRKSALEAHLEAKGKIVAITKAASYLLWSGYFSAIRQYLLDNMVFMVSDSTGIPPRFAKRAGFEQLTFGRFTSPFLDLQMSQRDEITAEFSELWEEQPRRKLNFRYGYPDGEGNLHLLITKPRERR